MLKMHWNQGCESSSLQLISSDFKIFSFFSFNFSPYFAFYADFKLFFPVFCQWTLTPLWNTGEPRGNRGCGLGFKIQALTQTLLQILCCNTQNKLCLFFVIFAGEINSSDSAVPKLQPIKCKCGTENCRGYLFWPRWNGTTSKAQKMYII